MCCIYMVTTFSWKERSIFRPFARKSSRAASPSSLNSSSDLFPALPKLSICAHGSSVSQSHGEDSLHTPTACRGNRVTYRTLQAVDLLAE